MKHILVLILTVTVVVSLATGVGVAQQNNSTAATDGPEYGQYEQIDNKTYLVESSVDLETGEASLVFYSEEPQSVTLSDAGAFVDGGSVNQEVVYLRPGQKTRVNFSISVVDQGLGQQFAGVSVTTSKTLYAVPLETSSPLIGGPWTYQDVQLVAVTVAATISTIVIVMLLRSRYDLDAEPERIA
ncbi:Uncharacterized protein HSR121_1750 [Halapricum desulfuricans]|uniref:Uncharacterized protein n=2 Tax=Halapricum desulfuricans TaxID=2841257 RepID=A0A897N594_9EURY|nr:Uncharacterized protein HSR121_1750 [Halapricum desulfuricans]